MSLLLAILLAILLVSTGRNLLRVGDSVGDWLAIIPRIFQWFVQELGCVA